MRYQSKRRHASLTFAIIMIVASTVTSTEVHDDLPTNHKDGIGGPGASSTLKMEPREEYDGLDLGAIEATKSSKSIHADHSSAKSPLISGPTSKVAVVYSERKTAETEVPIKVRKVTVEERNRGKPIGDNAAESATKTRKTTADERNWRVVKASSRDSYLNALEHSHASQDPREGVVRADTRPKIARPIRREYHEGPVYRPSGDQYGAPKEPSSTYGTDIGDSENHAASDFARISYEAPSHESFFPGPSDAHSLPVQSSVNFNDNRYGSPQVSYGPPQQTQTNYGAPPQPQTNYGAPSQPQTNYGAPSQPQTNYGAPPSYGYGPPASIPQNSYGPPSNIYPATSTAYKAPSTTYGAPYAIQDYSQNLPSLPNIGFSWPIALKLNAFTLAKILLKLVLFKMIVKFIAVICLLLFIPKLEIIKKGDKDDADEDEGRGLLSSDSALERLNVLTALVTGSIEKYEKETGKLANSDQECTGIGCRLRKFITFDQSWNDYGRLFKSYVAEETYNDAAERTVVNRVDS